VISDISAFIRSPPFSESALSASTRVLSNSCTCTDKSVKQHEIAFSCFPSTSTSRTYDEIDIFPLERRKIWVLRYCVWGLCRRFVKKAPWTKSLVHLVFRICQPIRILFDRRKYISSWKKKPQREDLLRSRSLQVLTSRSIATFWN
jgi:hypothetical protein